MPPPFGNVGKLPRGLPHQELPGRGPVRGGEGGPVPLPPGGEAPGGEVPLPGGEVSLPEAPPGAPPAPGGTGGPREAPRTPPTPTRLPGPRDGFGQGQAEAGTTLLAQATQTPARTVRTLLPALERFRGHEAVAARFGADLPLLRAQVMARELPPGEGAARLWAFFTAYAEAATAGQATPEGLEAFRQVLEAQGFGHFHDAHTGRPGVEAGMWVLQAPAPEQARQRAESVQLVPTQAPAQEGPEARTEQPPSTPRPSTPAAAERPEVPRELKDSAFVALERHARPAEERAHVEAMAREGMPLERVPGRPDTFRVNALAAEAGRPLVQPAEAGRARAQDATRLGGRPGRLGANMLFNVLHRFRAEGEDSSVEKAKWDRMAFGAVLLLVGVTLAAILLVLL